MNNREELHMYRKKIRNNRKNKRREGKLKKLEKNSNHKFLKMILYRNKFMFSFLKGIFNSLFFLIFYFVFFKYMERTPFIWTGAKTLGWIALIVTVMRLFSWMLAFRIT